MGEQDTHRANTEARADVAARRPRAVDESALMRYLAAAAYREAESENTTTDYPDEEATDEPPTTARDPGTEHG
jgi:hypothetical protein